MYCSLSSLIVSKTSVNGLESELCIPCSIILAVVAHLNEKYVASELRGAAVTFAVDGNLAAYFVPANLWRARGAHSLLGAASSAFCQLELPASGALPRSAPHRDRNAPNSSARQGRIWPPPSSGVARAVYVLALGGRRAKPCGSAADRRHESGGQHRPDARPIDRLGRRSIPCGTGSLPLAMMAISRWLVSSCRARARICSSKAAIG